LKIDPAGLDLHPLPLGRDSDIMVGSPVAALGSPFGERQSLSVGVVSATDRSIASLTNFQISGAVQTDAAINPGNSGGPLLDSAGRLIGVNTAIFSPSGASSGIGFAVPVDTVNRIIPQLLAEGKVSRPYLGAQVSDALSEQVAGQRGMSGVLVVSVETDSPAERAGLRGVQQKADGNLILGDVIQQVAGKPVRRVDELFAVIEQHKARQTIELRILREGKEIDVSVTLAPPQQ
ncbi:MAG: trypsin-like peptidase domain-containing protein, partial [Planctomycetota bacterium]|nr:trypsin-like peptidase domain-containing protein [Planctomycetota bacterium]